MHLTHLELKNFRGASSFALDFDPRLNVLVGMNGAGKSSVLDAVAIMLSWITNRIKSPRGSGRPIVETDIQNTKHYAGITLTCCLGDFSGQSWRLVKSRKGHLETEMRTSLNLVSQIAREFQESITASQAKVNLPLLAYYPVNRAVLDIPLRIRAKHSFDLLDTYDGSLTSGANFRTFFEWYREREDLENENRRYIDQASKPEDFQFPDPQLEAVRKAIGMLLPEFTNLSVRRKPLRMEVEKSGQRLTINQLSGGEKCQLALVGDLARRFAIANPIRKNPLEGEGIVLIDEIDLHLHPKWQRTVVPKLMEIFPNCQFLISTHSPSIISHVRPKSLFLLRSSPSNIEVVRPGQSYGKNVDRILEDIMGLETTRPDAVKRDLEDIYQLIEQGEFENAKTRISVLETKIGEDPDLVKAGVLIRRKVLLGQ